MDRNLDNQLLETQTLTLFHQKRFSLASLKLRRMLQNQSPRKAQIYDWLGGADLESGQPFKNVDHKYKRSLLFNDPNFPFIHYSLAAFLSHQTKFEEARPHIEEFVRRKGSNPQGLHLMAKIYFSLGLYEDADKVYMKLYNRDWRFLGLYDGWACNYYYQGKFDLAKEKLLKGLQVHPENSEVHRMMGYVLMNEQKYQEAIDCFEKAAEIQPSEIMTWINWSLALLAQNKEDEAKSKYERGFELLEVDKRFNKKEELLQVLNADLKFKQRYIETGNDEQRKIAFEANLEGVKKMIALLGQDMVQEKTFPLRQDKMDLVGI